MPQWELGLQMEQIVWRTSILLPSTGTLPLSILSRLKVVFPRMTPVLLADLISRADSPSPEPPVRRCGLQGCKARRIKHNLPFSQASINNFFNLSNFLERLGWIISETESGGYARVPTSNNGI
jgi:hypothetical protein